MHQKERTFLKTEFRSKLLSSYMSHTVLVTQDTEMNKAGLLSSRSSPSRAVNLPNPFSTVHTCIFCLMLTWQGKPFFFSFNFEVTSSFRTITCFIEGRSVSLTLWDLYASMLQEISYTLSEIQQHTKHYPLLNISAEYWYCNISVEHFTRMENAIGWKRVFPKLFQSFIKINTNNTIIINNKTC